MIVAVSGLLLAFGVAWVLGRGAAWWLEHVDKVPVGGKDGLGARTGPRRWAPSAAA
ncbi:hypothetical protein ACGFNU_37890 [Spirillospora sp. NPDC048911]|uniref:hypothetical protein n=1 Tax=Spirillospora sp. NPDC048911 TaxID=3364527 RepID=UPI003712802B